MDKKGKGIDVLGQIYLIPDDLRCERSKYRGMDIVKESAIPDYIEKVIDGIVKAAAGSFIPKY
ncbi:MAG: hypothetical protein ABIG84_04655 [archaeon]